MAANNFTFYGGKIIAKTALNIAIFPVWWYARGLVMIVGKLLGFLGSRQQSLGLFVWVKNIYRPMYGQSDWQGILISIFMRIIQVIIRSIAMLFWLGAGLVLLAAWISLPPFVIYQIYFQLIS
jgi:hypothetical protein